MSAAHDSDRNLLFAVLALQADCITHDQFVEICTLWVSRKEASLADLLVEKGWITAEDRSDVQKLVDRKLKKHGGDAKASLAEATSDAARISLAGAADPNVRSLLAPHGGGHILFSTSAFLPEDRDRYTITRLHSTGGIGRVWLARDGSLGRDVALKELRPERAANPAVWERFLREAQITGQLEHPGIVPVYELSRRSTDQQPFYTMRFVRGLTFREKIAVFHQRRLRNEAGPLERRDLLTAFVGVCHAVAYAHSRGIIHRDLKPANIVLGEFGEVMVLDWGLAKSLASGPESPEETSAIDSTPGSTLEGQVLGTPAYMAPEQAEGRLADIDRRTDVYGLGAILYEVLAGRPPFNGESTDEVLSRVRTLAPAPPRETDTTVPRSVEAISLVALRKKPAERYASADALRLDVERFLADEPVSVFREPLVHRAARWAKRHRTLVSSAVAVLVVAVPILLAAVFLLNESEQREREARLKEEDARQRAQENYRRTLRAADALSEELARGIRPIAGTQSKAVVAILDRTKSITDDLVADADAPPEAHERRARLLIQFAELYRDTNRSTSSREAAKQAVDIYDRLIAASPDDAGLKRGRAKARFRLGWELQDQGYDEDSLRTFEQCIAEFESVGTGGDQALEAVYHAGAHTFRANELAALGRATEAEAAYAKSVAMRRAAWAKAPDDPDVGNSLVIGLERYSIHMTRFHPESDWPALYREALAVQEKLCSADPWNAANHMALMRLRISSAQSSEGEAEAAAAVTANDEIVQRFAQRDPDHMVWKREVVRQRFYRNAMQVRRLPFLEPAQRPAVKAAELAIIEELAEAAANLSALDPENHLWMADVANFQSRAIRARLERADAEPKEASIHVAKSRQLVESAKKLFSILSARSPKNADTEQGVNYLLSLIAWIEEKHGTPAAAIIARAEYTAADVRLHQRLLTLDPDCATWAGLLDAACFRTNHLLKLLADANAPAALSAPGAMEALLSCAETILRTPAPLPEKHKARGADARQKLTEILRALDAKGLLPPNGKALLAQ